MPANDGVAGRLELVRRSRVLAVRDAVLEVEAGRLDRRLDTEPTHGDIHHHLQNRPGEPAAARRADHEPRPALTQDE